MNAYHYTREAGELGQVLAAEGSAAGRTLEELLGEQRPPLRAALELGAALADILCIAEEDGAFHGDLSPRVVRVATNGNVSVEGFGVPRARSCAPEGVVNAASVDIYGLGLVLHAALSPTALGAMPSDADGHDDAVIDRVMGFDFREVQGKRWLQEVRTFLCKILAWHVEERPVALDAANVLGSVADELPGDGLPEWAVATAVPTATTGATPLRAMPVDVEILGGPTSLSAPMARGAVRQAPSSKGESTSFWSREKIAQMLAEEDDDGPFDAPSPMGASDAGEDLPAARPLRSVAPPRPEPSNTLHALPRSGGMADAPPSYGRAAPPPPPSLPRPAEVPPADDPVPAAPPFSSGTGGSPGPSPLRPPSTVPAPQPVRHVSAGAAYGGAGGNGAAAQRPRVTSVELDDPFAEPPPKSSGKGLAIGVGVGVVLVLVCGGVLLAGGGAWLFTRDDATAATEVVPAPGTAANETPGGAEGAAGSSSSGSTSSPGTATTPPAAGSSGTSSSSKSTGSGGAATSTSGGSSSSKSTSSGGSSSGASSSTKSTSGGGSSSGASSSTKSTSSASSSSPKPATTTTTKASTPAPAPAPAPTDGPYTVRFSVPGKEGRVQCGDGQTTEFVGSTTMSFTGTVTCRVKVDKLQGVVQIERGGTVTCSDNGSVLSCGAS